MCLPKNRSGVTRFTIPIDRDRAISPRGNRKKFEFGRKGEQGPPVTLVSFFPFFLFFLLVTRFLCYFFLSFYFILLLSSHFPLSSPSSSLAFLFVFFFFFFSSWSLDYSFSWPSILVLTCF